MTPEPLTGTPTHKVLEDVKIVRLEPIRVACVNGYGSEPESLAFKKMSAYVEAKGLKTDGQQHRFFGYNNPNPAPGSPNYGYDVWVTVDQSFQSEGEVKVFDFPGGLYAVTSIRPITGEEIFETWQQLVTWRERSKYRSAHHQWLEEHIGDIDLSFPDLILDLYMPIAM
jgi:AraC family transcriptional regulator